MAFRGFAFASLLVAIGCTGEEFTSAPAESDATAGSGGVSGTGSSGSSGSGGASGGASGNGGSSGGSGRGGSAGGVGASGGAAGSDPTDGAGGTGAAGRDAGTGGSSATGGSAGASDAPPAFGKAVHWDDACATPNTASARTVFSATAFTVELWLLADTTASAWQHVVYRGGNSSTGPAGWTLELADTGNGTHVLQLCGSNGSSHACVSSPQELTIRRPYHVAVVRLPPGHDCAPLGTAGCVKYYVAAGDGPTRPHSESIRAFAVDWASAEPMRLGGGLSDCGAYRMHADTDELRIWARARSRSEIDAAANQAVSCSEPGLAAYYRFEENSPNTLLDCTQPNGGATIGGEFTRIDSPFD